MGESKQSFKTLEVLRGYMAWSVVLDHAVGFAGLGTRVPSWLADTILNGARAVNVFIIVSGFVITHLLMVRQESYGPYLYRRALRIVPIYWLCLLIALFMLPWQIELHGFPWVTDHATWIDGFQATQEHLFTHLLLHLTLLHGLLPDSLLNFADWTILGPAWSLSLEWQFYLVAPWLVRTMRSSFVAMAAVAGALVGAFALFHSSRFGYWRLPSMLILSVDFFLLGILSRLYFKRLLAAPRWLIPLLGSLMMVCAWSRKYEIGVWALFLYSTVSEARGGIQMSAVLRRLTINRLFSSLGRVSYSTYLVHIPVFAAIVHLGRSAFGLDSQGDAGILLMIATLLVIPISFLLYRYIEAPFIAFGGRRAHISPIVPVGKTLTDS